MKIAVFGTGSVGRTLAARLHELGHDVVLGTRDPDATRSRTVNVQGALIQLSGLYALSSAWTDTDPSALTTRSRGAIGRCAVSFPA